MMPLFYDARRRMHETKAYLWSLNVSDNAFYMCCFRASTRLGLCNGFFWGCLNRKLKQLELQHGDGHEDVERTVRYFSHDGLVLRYREFCAKTRCKSNAGGLQSSMSKDERETAEKQGVKRLIEEFPHLLVEAPDSILGVKFKFGGPKFHSVVSATEFRDLTALSGLPLLQGARWVSAICSKVDELVSGTIVRCGVEGICLKCDQAGELKRCTVGKFYRQLRERRLTISWVPRKSCGKLGVEYVEMSDELKELCERRGPKRRKTECSSTGGA